MRILTLFIIAGIGAAGSPLRIYVTNSDDDKITLIDPVSNQVAGKIIRRVPIGMRPNNVAITADGKRVYVCIRGKSWVDIVDTASLEKVKSVEVGKGPHNIYRTPD